MPTEEFTKLCGARVRRRFSRGLGSKPMGLITKLRAAKLACEPNEKPAIVKTHLRNMIVVPEMIVSLLVSTTVRFSTPLKSSQKWLVTT